VKLLGPTNLGPLALRNRIALCPMGVNLDGDDRVAWFEARARGGAGLILVGSVSVLHPVGSFDERQAALATDEQAADLQRTVDAVHASGAAIAAQLVHGGQNALLDVAAGRPFLVPSRKRPSAPDELTSMLTADEATKAMAPFLAPTALLEAKEATDDDLAAVVDAFAAAARRAVAIGFDGIELHAGHGYLLDAFLSPCTNRRDDRWGGDARRRAELLVEVVRAVKAAIPPTTALWARVNGEERHRDGGQTLDDALAAMQAGLDNGLDALHVTAYADPMVAIGITDAHTPHRPGALLPLARRVRHELGAPVIGFGRLTPEAAEQAIADGDCDIVAMGRPLIADPDLPAKLAAGRRDRIRPCAYQYRCIGAIFLNEPVSCTVNPDAGREAHAAAAPAAAPKRVVVAGGGPAGLECARRLAERGHDVVLHEATDRLGGMLRVAEVANPDLAGLADWLAAAAVDAGVDVRLGSTVDGSLVDADALVWAAGADWPGLHGGVPAAAAAVVGDGAAALAVARRLAPSMLFAGAPVVAPELGLPGRFRAVHDARQAGVTIVLDGTPPPDAFDARRGGPRQAPAVDVPVHVIGDAGGSAGLAAALAIAARVAADL
jgi:2,4-dienoyl-CoA reductase (NADPH2)